MDFETFAKLYDFLSVRLNRANMMLTDRDVDLLEVVEGNDSQDYQVAILKRGEYLSLVVSHVSEGLIIRVTAQRDTRAISLDGQTRDIIAILDLFENENLNGLDTMAYSESQTRRVDPLAEYNETQQYAEKAARLIVAGIGETPELTPEDQAMVANEIIAILKDPAPFGFAARVQRTIAWAMRPETQPEWGFYVASWVMRTYPEHVETPHAEVFARFSPVGQHVSTALL